MEEIKFSFILSRVCMCIAIFIFFSLVNQPVCTVPRHKHVSASHQWPKIRCGRDYIFFHFIQSVHVQWRVYIHSPWRHPCARFSGDGQNFSLDCIHLHPLWTWDCDYSLPVWVSVNPQTHTFTQTQTVT